MDNRKAVELAKGADRQYGAGHKLIGKNYATPDLQNLPDMLEQRIQTGKYHSAVAGTCPVDRKSGFSGYRVAVLLFE